MKKFMILALAVILAACSSAPAAVATEPPAPTEVLPTQTPIVVVQTVVVESTPVPAEVQPTQVPPTAPPVIVNVVVPTTAPVDTGTTTTSASPDPNAPIALENALGKGVFINLTVSGDAFTLRCFPRELTFTASAIDPITVTDAVFYYRTVDLQRLYPSEWVSGGEMDSDGNGNFTLVFSGEDVNPNLRLDGAYLDFQIVGLNRGGGRVDATEKIEGLIKYTFDCP